MMDVTEESSKHVAGLDVLEKTLSSNILSDSTVVSVSAEGTHATKVKRNRRLPQWLLKPTLCSPDLNKGVLCSDVDFLSETILQNLINDGVEHLFPVQALVIPEVISQHHRQYNCNFPPREICVQAPTGSGKTLAYVLPIIDLLSKCLIKRLYCLVVLPSKDLAQQVKNVFQSYCHGTNVNVILISGSMSFSKEKEILASVNKADIMVCTPGRLVDHLQYGEEITLKYLKFLVIDEVDRLLAQEYHGWLQLVNLRLQTIYPMNVSTYSSPESSLQKLLFSATLTKNPEELALLNLNHPKFFSTYSKQENGDDMINENINLYIVPEGLSEKMIVVDIGVKPLVILHLILNLRYSQVLCFVKSKEATHRLCTLMTLLGRFSVAEFSSNLSETQRKGIIRDFQNGKIDLLVASDAMGRGIDLDSISLVINYDSTNNAKTYVHRIGRTARAGATGEAISFLTQKEVYHFKEMRKKLSAKSGGLTKISVAHDEIIQFEPEYQMALKELQRIVVQEKKQLCSSNFIK